MKPSTTITAIIALSSTLSVWALSAQAHDPSQHRNTGEKPRCEALQGMDPEAADRDDPVVQALLRKCEKQLHGDKEAKHGGAHGGEHEGEHGEEHRNEND